MKSNMEKEYELSEEDKDLISEVEFNVRGAGTIQIGKYNNASCGGELGFSIGVSWGRFGKAGGVIPNEEARKLAEHILNRLNAK